MPKGKGYTSKNGRSAGAAMTPGATGGTKATFAKQPKTGKATRTGGIETPNMLRTNPKPMKTQPGRS